MAEDTIRSLLADRIGGASFGKGETLYKFEKIKRAKREAVRANPALPLIDLGVGEPDSPADRQIAEVLAREAGKPENRGYADNGIDLFKEAAARYMDRVYGVPHIDPETEIVHAIGSKPALAMLPQAFINPGDVSLVTVPGYPILGTMTGWLGGSVYPVPLTADNGFLPDLSAIPSDVLKRAKLFYVNYPNNPTGASATVDFFRRLVDFAREHNLLVVQDAAYAALTFGGEKPLSFLSVEGAKEVGVEIHSLSKAFNMTGWRLAFVAGNALAVAAFSSVKDNNDSGQFRAIQHAGAYALEHDELTRETAKKYERRHALLASALSEAGFTPSIPRASFYQYVAIPKRASDGTVFETAEECCDYLIRRAMISAVPWDDAGHYLRLSVTFEADGEEAERAVCREIARRLSALGFVFRA